MMIFTVIGRQYYRQIRCIAAKLVKKLKKIFVKADLPLFLRLGHEI